MYGNGNSFSGRAFPGSHAALSVSGRRCVSPISPGVHVNKAAGPLLPAGSVFCPIRLGRNMTPISYDLTVSCFEVCRGGQGGGAGVLICCLP